MKCLLLFFLSCPIWVCGQTLRINTIAGTHIAGYSGNGGPAIAANLYQPNQIAIDTAGNVYVAETGNHVVRKISTTGTITVVAGTHSPGYSGDGGPALAAKLFRPSAVCFDRSGNLYIAEIGNSCVRKINTSGIISTYAGTGTAGYGGDSGLASAANLHGPFAIACDTANNLYIADSYNNRVRKVDGTTGIITTIAGTGTDGYSGDGGPAIDAQLSFPIDIAIDKQGNIFIDDIDSSVIRKINPSGIISTVAGTGTVGYSGDGGPATLATLQYPYAIGVDTSDNLLITDNGNNVIRKVNSSGIISTIAGTGAGGYSGDGGPALMAQIYNTGGVKPDSRGNIYIADFGNNVIRKITPDVTGIMTPPTGESIAFSVCPNPVSNTLLITSNQLIANLQISDAMGRTMYSSDIRTADIKVDVATYPAGVYFVRINNNEFKRFIKQ